MNSFELADQMRRISLDSACDSIPPPPLSLDCFGFDKYNSMSSFQSNQSQASTGSLSSSRNKSLSRSRCVANLSAMCSVSTEGTSLSRSSVPLYEISRPNEGGYFVDSVE